MELDEIIKGSSLRTLEQEMQKLVPGDIAVIAGEKGIGKTACLVHIATDQLLQGRHVIHVSFSNPPEGVIAWYDEILAEIAARFRRDIPAEQHDEIMKGRVVMSFKQDGAHWTRVQKDICALIDSGAFSANVVVIDGYDFVRATGEEIDEVAAFARERGLCVWFSASVDRVTVCSSRIPDRLERFSARLAAIILLCQEPGSVRLSIVSDHGRTPGNDTRLNLDPRMLLITRQA